MNTIPVHRRGRRYFTPGPKFPRDRHSNPNNSNHDERKKGFCFWLGTFLLVLLPFYIFLHMEHRRFAVYTALSEISNGDIIELPLFNDGHHQPQLLKQGDIVHGSSRNIRSKVKDPSLGITIDHALTLERNTEFCQWQEFQSESCQTCSRTIRKEDGSGRSHTETENYQCDCVVQYDYYKTWRPYLINSLLFDQPAAHYNPQRNPLPSSYLVSNDALMEFTSTHTDADHHPLHHDHADSRSMSVMARISPAMLAKRVNGASARTVKWVRDGIPPIPPFWKRWIPDRSRYEDVRNLDYTYMYRNTHGYDRMSMSNPDERFAYVGDGFFFSPHEPSKMEKMFKVFGEYLEGSLFDWQLGDIFPSCTPGDIRIRYSVQDPDVVSVLGYVAVSKKVTREEIFVELEPIKTKNGELMSMVHSGSIGAPEMIEREDLQSRRMAIFFRMLSLLWVIAVVYRIGFIAGYDIRKSTYFQQFQMTCAYWSFVIAMIWSKTWGVSKGGNILFSVSFILLAMVIQNPPPRVTRIHTSTQTNEKQNTREYDASAWNDKSEWVEQ